MSDNTGYDAVQLVSIRQAMKWPARSAAYGNAHLCLKNGNCSELQPFATGFCVCVRLFAFHVHVGALRAHIAAVEGRATRACGPTQGRYAPDTS